MSKFEETQMAQEMADRAHVGDDVDPKITITMQRDDIKRLHGLPNMKPELLLQVIGYLVTYAVAGRYNDVLIYRDGNDMMASYRRDDGGKFFMCAHWDEYSGKWGTHS